MSTDIKSSSTATQVGLLPREKAAAKNLPQPPAQHGVYEDAEARTGNQGLLDALSDSVESGSNQTTLPPNGTFSLWQMLMAIMQYEKTLINNNATLQQMFAKNLGGTHGFFSELFNTGCSVGKMDAASMKDDAYGKITSAGLSATSLITTGVQYAINTRAEINAGNAKLQDATDFENTMKGSSAGIQIGHAQGMENGPLTQEQQAEVNARVDGWADGTRSIDNFKAVNADGSVNAEEARFNHLAAEHVPNDQTKYSQVMKRVSEAKKSAQDSIGQATTRFNTFEQQVNMAIQGLQNAAIGGATIAGADAAKAKAEYNAAQTTLSQIVQELAKICGTQAQNAETALNQANQFAAAFASAASAQVHG